MNARRQVRSVPAVGRTAVLLATAVAALGLAAAPASGVTPDIPTPGARTAAAHRPATADAVLVPPTGGDLRFPRHASGMTLAV